MQFSRPTKQIAEIEAWFRAQEDGEFCALPADHPSVRSGDSTHAGLIVYTTSHRVLSRIRDLAEMPQPVALLERPGLPTSHDLPWLLGSGTSQRRIVIGDADPPDLLAFSWIRQHLPIDWHGVSDAFLVRHGTRELDRIRIPLSAAERAAIPQLARWCPDYRELLGEYCASLGDHGLKIEIAGATIEQSAV